MKMLRGKTLMSIIYAALLALPLVSIGVRCAYVAANKNAYQSYTGYNIESNTELATKIESGLQYQFSTNNYNGTIESTSAIKVSNLNITSNYGNFNTWYDANKDSIKYIQIFVNSTNKQIKYLDEDMTQLTWYSLTSNMYNFSFTSENNSTLTNNDLIYRVYQQQVGNSLDNVFDYSVNQLVSENNFGQLNFFQWFNNFLLNDQQNNLLYVRFANWYLNYAMLISLMQILFLVLMWFVNFSRKLLERGMNFYD